MKNKLTVDKFVSYDSILRYEEFCKNHPQYKEFCDNVIRESDERIRKILNKIDDYDEDEFGNIVHWYISWADDMIHKIKAKHDLYQKADRVK